MEPMSAPTINHDKLQAVRRCIREAAHQTAESGLSAPVVERFLLTGEKTWDGAGSGRFTLAQFNEDEAYSRGVKTALRTLFRQLGDLLPTRVRLKPKVASEEIRRRLEPMVKGLLQDDWQQVALTELIARTFVLNFQGGQEALEAELSTCFGGASWQILWMLFDDHGLKPEEIETPYDGTAQSFAHIRWSSYQSKDPYSDVVVHEAAHLLHYLKPGHYGLQVRRGQERFVDVEFAHRELFAFSCEAYCRLARLGDRKSRIAFAESMCQNAFSFPRNQVDEIAALVLNAARARNGWRVIREATVQRNRRRANVLTKS